MARIIETALQNEHMQGVYNAAAPDAVTNKAMTRLIARKLHRPFILPNVPVLALKAFIGEFAEVLLTDLNISVARMREAGFDFQFSTMDKALDDLLQAKDA